MKLQKIIVLFICLIFFSIRAADSEMQETARKSAKLEKQITFDLHNCTDEKLGVTFLCHPDWELKTEENVLFIVIMEDPLVTLTIAKSDTPVVFLKQLTRPALQEMGQYADGFKVWPMELAGHEALQVEAVSQKQADIYLYDHYLIHDLNLYSVLFSVTPKKYWPHYETLIKKIIAGFQFISSIKNISKSNGCHITLLTEDSNESIMMQ